MMLDIERKIMNQIEAMKDEILSFQRQIIQISSINPPGNCKEIAHLIENKMKEIGLTTMNKRQNIIGELGMSNHPALILYGHMDTVEVFQGWTKDPFGGEIIGNKMYGRGAADNKASITAEVFAAKALIESGVKLNGKLILTAVTDEELGGMQGVKYLLKRGFIKGDACLLGDGPSTYPLGYCGGAIFMLFRCNGKQTHMMFPDLPPPYRDKNFSGINAIQKMLKILNFLNDLQNEFNQKETEYPTLPGSPLKVSYINPAIIKGGTKISNVPGDCMLQCSLITIPEQSVKSIISRITAHIKNLNAKDPELNVDFQILKSYEPQVINPESDFAKIFGQSLKSVLNEERQLKTCFIPTDAHYFQEKGIETILYGAIHPDNNIHTADEFVYINDLLNTTKVFALTTLNFLK